MKIIIVLVILVKIFFLIKSFIFEVLKLFYKNYFLLLLVKLIDLFDI